eukprot:scaffold29032_cov60-Phaeocystis_antarctica.AAC.2
MARRTTRPSRRTNRRSRAELTAHAMGGAASFELRLQLVCQPAPRPSFPPLLPCAAFLPALSSPNASARAFLSTVTTAMAHATTVVTPAATTAVISCLRLVGMERVVE